MAAAILDRVLERGRFIHLDEPSGRTRHPNLEEILPAGTDRARISETHTHYTVHVDIAARQSPTIPRFIVSFAAEPVECGRGNTSRDMNFLNLNIVENP